MHAGDEIDEEGHHLDCSQAKNDGELLFECVDDLEGLEQLDNTQRLECPGYRMLKFCWACAFKHT